MNEQEYNNAVQLLLSQEGNNYLLGLYFLLEYKSLEHICDLILERYKKYNGILWFGDYYIVFLFWTKTVTTYKKSKKEFNDDTIFESKIPNNKSKYNKELFRRELHKHLIRIFDSLV